MASQGINLPSGFGGLMRYNEEYASKINLKPVHVIAFVIFVIVLRMVLPTILG